MEVKTNIEMCVSDIIDYISKCKPAMLSKENVLVNRDEIENLLVALQEAIPDDIRKYQNLLENHQEIIRDAEIKAQNKLAEAESIKNSMISESQMIKDAQLEAENMLAEAERRANEIIEEANNTAFQITMSANEYTDEILCNLSDIIDRNRNETIRAHDEYIAIMNDYYNTIMENREQLAEIKKQKDVMNAIATVEEINSHKE